MNLFIFLPEYTESILLCLDVLQYLCFMSFKSGMLVMLSPFHLQSHFQARLQKLVHRNQMNINEKTTNPTLVLF
jgi:hypothetical protein